MIFSFQRRTQFGMRPLETPAFGKASLNFPAAFPVSLSLGKTNAARPAEVN